MGTVHAKSLHNSMTEGGDRLLDFDEAIELEDEPISKPTIRLNGVRARVDRVHVDGLNRTNDDIIRSTVDELFHATDFEDVILRAHKVRRALDSMGCFRDIGVSIDVSSGPGATPEGLEVTFQVVELSRIVGGVNTTVSENEGNLVLGVKLPNVLGRGEKVQAEYSLGHRSSSNFSLHATKPFPHKHAVPVGETVQEEYSLGHRSSSNFSLHATKPFPHKHAVPVYVLTHTHPLTHSNVLGRGETVQAEYSLGHRSSSNFSLHATKPFSHKHAVPVLSASVYQQNQEFPWSGYRLLDRGLLLDIAFRTSPKTTHNLQWEGMVRDTAVLSKNTSFKVRESSGPQMKSVVRHSVSVDHRDEPIFPTRGAYVQFSSEVCGLGGGVAHLKNELKAQQNLSLTEHIVLQLSGACGVLHDVFGTEIPEHLFLGGPTTMRGFQQRGVGPHSDGLATGGKMYWAGGVHVYSPLPFQAGRGGLGELFRSHVFLNAGCLAMPEEGGIAALERLREVRVAGGLGVALRLGRAARLELNYCVPLRALRGDRAHAGLQFGLGAHFL